MTVGVVAAVTPRAVVVVVVLMAASAEVAQSVGRRTSRVVAAE